MSTQTKNGNGNAPQQAAVETRPVAVDAPTGYSVTEIKARVNKVNHILKDVMVFGMHYGTIPGCGDKPALLKAGAELLLSAFELAPEIVTEIKELPQGHREVNVTVKLLHAPTGKFWGMGIGSCSTMEAKYRYRNASRKCPACGKETILKSKNDPGWFCWAKKGGCGKTFTENDSAVVGQPLGKVENGDIADTWNTVLKQAKKRALVDAALTALAASGIFTQDTEELEDFINNIDIEGTEKAHAEYLLQQQSGSGPAPTTQPHQRQLSDRAKNIIDGWSRASVQKWALEKFIGRPATEWTAQDCDRIRDLSSHMRETRETFWKATNLSPSDAPDAPHTDEAPDVPPDADVPLFGGDEQADAAPSAGTRGAFKG